MPPDVFCRMLLASIGIALVSLLCARGSPPAGLLPLPQQRNPQPGHEEIAFTGPWVLHHSFGALLHRDQPLTHREEISEGEAHKARSRERSRGPP
jgi:hypothetical protein